MDYSGLKKRIYAIEHAKHAGGGGAPTNSSFDPSANTLVAEFFDYLALELGKTVIFYRETEKELHLNTKKMLVDIEADELYGLIRSDEAGVAAHPIDLLESSTPVMDPGGISVNLTNSIFTDYSGMTSSATWNAKSMKIRKKHLTSTCIEVYVSMKNLVKFGELNYTGFNKILKKFDKVTGMNCKNAWLIEHADTAYPFLDVTRVKLEEKLTECATAYAKLVTGNRFDLAIQDLDSHLREQIVWERNTIWRDMIEQERKSAAIGFQKITHQRAPTADPEQTERQVFCLGQKFRIPDVFNWPIVLAIFASTVFITLLVFPVFESPEQSNCLAILILASMLWAFELIPLFVTSLLIPLLVVFLRVLREPVGDAGEWIRLDAKHAAKRIFSEMFSPVIMLLLGGFSLAAALSKHNIAKRMASVVLARAGSEPWRVLLANMFVSTFASMWISNVAAPVLCFELVKPILRNLPHGSPYARCLILGIAMAANVGGMASPIASPQNIIAVGNMNPPPSWPEWFLIALPVCIVIDILIWAILLLIFHPSDATSPPEVFGVRDMDTDDEESTRLLSTSYDIENSIFQRTVSTPGLMITNSTSSDCWTRSQIYIIIVTGITIILWCLESRVEGIVGDMGVIAIIPMLAFFGTGILNKEDFNNFLWTVIMLAMGGIALGKAVELSGLLHEITRGLIPLLEQMSPFGCFVVMTGVIGVATTFVSHTVGALIILPIVKQVGISLPTPLARTLVMGAALMCSGAMGLPVSSFPNMNAISQEDVTGVPWLSVVDFLKIGIVSTLISWASVNTIAYGIMMLVGFQ